MYETDNTWEEEMNITSKTNRIEEFLQQELHFPELFILSQGYTPITRKYFDED